MANDEDPFATFEESLTKAHSKGKPMKKHHDKLIKKNKAIHSHPHPQSHAQKHHKHHSHHKKVSVPACTSLGCKTETAADHAPDPWPKDYPVANWGTDHDVDTTQKNAAAAEAKLGAWNPK